MARRVLCVALATLLLACLASAAHSNTFFVLGDWGSASIPAFAPTQKSVAVSMGKVAAKLKPNFIVSTGDNFYDAGVESTKDPLWKDAWKSMYDADALQVPWYVALGNHDWMGLVDAQLQFNDKNWKMPANYFSVKDDKLNLTLVVIDTTPLLHLYRTVPESLQMLQQLKVAPPTKEQYDWLEATLKQAAAQTRWTVVVGHHQIYSAHGNGSYETGWEELQKGVQPLFAKYGVHMYLCGHVHNLQHIEAYGVHYFVSGAGSRLQMATRSENTGEATSHFWAENPGFLALAVDINNITATFYGSNEDVLYTTVVNHNETITEHDDRILGLPPTTLYPIAFVGTFVVIGVSVLAFVLIKRRCAARPAQISLPLEDPTEDTDTLV